MNDTALPSEFAPLNDATIPLTAPAASNDPWAALSMAPDASATAAWLDAPPAAPSSLAASSDATAAGLQLQRFWDGSLPIATVGGLGIVLLAISLDRLTQAMSRSRRGAGRRWWHAGPAGFALRGLHRLVRPPRGDNEAFPALSARAQ